jgi:beta-lactamase class A
MCSFDRRGALLGAAAIFATGLQSARAAPRARLALERLERKSGGRLGVHIAFLDERPPVGWRADERFGLCSTFKLPLAAMILADIDAGMMSADERIAYTEKDMVAWAPVTGPRLAEGAMSALELAKAAQTKSDNVAANLLLQRVGGPAGFTRRLRAWNDRMTRLDRYELDLNLVPKAKSATRRRRAPSPN